jgi:proliferating cell nuclear antigen
MTETATLPALDARTTVGGFQPFFEAVNGLVDEAKFRFDADGLSVTAVDPANVGMVNAHLSAEAFTEYDAEEGVVGLATEKVSDLLDTADERNPLRLTRTGEKELTFTVDGFEYAKGCIKPGSIRKEPDIPRHLDLPATVRFDAGLFKRAVKRCDIAADHVGMAVDPDGPVFRMVTEGSTDTATLEVDTGRATFESVGEANSIYSLDYLKDMADSIPENTEVVLLVGEEYPLFIEYGYEGAAVEYLLAPRIGGVDD